MPDPAVKQLCDAIRSAEGSSVFLWSLRFGLCGSREDHTHGGVNQPREREEASAGRAQST
jgi:hypothetical protein